MDAKKKPKTKAKTVNRESKKIGAPMGNKNAETWTLKEAKEAFLNAISICKTKEDYIVSGNKIKGFKYHFVGEIASDLGTYSDLYKYLNSKFDELENYYLHLKTCLESNCFYDSKRGIIKEATAIMNLKSNYGWTDRVDNTTKGESINIIDLGAGKKPE